MSTSNIARTLASLRQQLAELQQKALIGRGWPRRARVQAFAQLEITLDELQAAVGGRPAVQDERKDHPETGVIAGEAWRESQEQLAVILRGVVDGITVQSPTGRLLYANAAAAELIGAPSVEELLQAPLGVVMERFEVMDEEGQPLPLRQLPGQRALRGEPRAEAVVRFRVKATGEERWSQVKASPVCDEHGKVRFAVNIFHDITARKRAEQALQESHNLLRAVIEGTLDAVFVKDRQGRYVMINAAGARWLGKSMEEIIGKDDRALFPPDSAAFIREQDRRVLSTGEPLEYELTVTLASGTWTYLSVKGPYRDQHGNIIGVIGDARDITERKRMEEGQRFLAEASMLLASSLDYETTLASVARLAVPHLADWCAVDVVKEDGQIHRLAVTHVDPTKVEWAYAMQRRYPLDPQAPYGAPQVLRTGQPEFYPDIPDALLVAAAQDAEQLEILRAVGLKSAMLVPLVARGRTVGALSFVSAESGRHYAAADLAVAEDLARRAALAIDNAQLYQAAEQARAQAEVAHQRYQELVNSVSAIVWEGDPQTFQFTFVSRRAEELLGYPIERWLADFNFWVNLIHPEDRERVMTLCRIATAEGRDHDFEYRARAADGRVVWLRDLVYVALDDKGQARQLRGVMIDITARKCAEEELRLLNEELEHRVRARTAELLAANDTLKAEISERQQIEEKLRKNERLLAEAQHLARLGSWEWEIPMNRLTWSDELCRVYGVSAHEFTGTYEAFLARLHPDDREFVEDVIEQASRTQQPFEFDHRIVRSDGTVRFLHGRGTVIGDAEGNPIRMFGTGQDITERKQAEAELQTYGEVLNSMVEGVVVTTEEGTIFFTNPALDHMFGYQHGELIGKHVSVLNAFPQEERADLVAATVEQLRRHGAWYGEIKNCKKDGAPFTTYARISTLEMPGQRYFVSVQEDITERKQMEEKLRESERLATIGSTAAKLAHEIGNPLNGMSTTVQLLERYLAKLQAASDELLASTVQDLGHEIHRLQTLLQELRGLARPARLALQPTDLAVVVAEVLKIHAPTYIERGIYLEQAFPANLPPVPADREKLKQVLLNLFKNAVEAMPEGGTLTVRGYQTEAQVCLEVRDTGIGIPEGLNIFEPFTTTKPEGTGLGLAVVQQIMLAHGGTVTYTRTPGQGTTMSLKLPLGPAEAEGWV